MPGAITNVSKKRTHFALLHLNTLTHSELLKLQSCASKQRNFFSFGKLNRKSSEEGKNATFCATLPRFASSKKCLGRRKVNHVTIVTCVNGLLADEP